MISAETLRFEIEGRFAALEADLPKSYISVRWESGPKIVRVGACLDRYDWETRSRALRTLLAFERDHADEFALEFDIVPLAAVQDDSFAEA